MSYINAKLNNNPMFEANVLSTVASAYEKGIVDYSDHLITQRKLHIILRIPTYKFYECLPIIFNIVSLISILYIYSN